MRQNYSGKVRLKKVTCPAQILPLFCTFSDLSPPSPRLCIFDIIICRITFYKQLSTFSTEFSTPLFFLHSNDFHLFSQIFPKPANGIFPFRPSVVFIYIMQNFCFFAHTAPMRRLGTDKSGPRRRRRGPLSSIGSLPGPWWLRRSAPAPPGDRPGTRSSPGRRSWRRCRRTSAEVAGIA